ncbi:hypothetical protein ACFQ4K_17375 [Tistrella bauzanensis]
MTITSSGDDLGHMTGDGVWIRATARLADACGLALMIFILATILLGEMPLPVQRGSSCCSARRRSCCRSPACRPRGAGPPAALSSTACSPSPSSPPLPGR